jgi:menaquinone-dependent protoporphyrinogen oxidase
MFTGGASVHVEKFEAETGWRPAHVGLFSGGLL